MLSKRYPFMWENLQYMKKKVLPGSALRAFESRFYRLTVLA